MNTFTIKNFNLNIQLCKYINLKNKIIFVFLIFIARVVKLFMNYSIFKQYIFNQKSVLAIL